MIRTHNRGKINIKKGRQGGWKKGTDEKTIKKKRNEKKMKENNT